MRKRVFLFYIRKKYGKTNIFSIAGPRSNAAITSGRVSTQTPRPTARQYFFFHFFHTIFGESFFDLFFFSSGVPFVPIRRPSQLLPLPCGDALRPEIPHLQLAIIFFVIVSLFWEM